eukprot:UN07153
MNLMDFERGEHDKIRTETLKLSHFFEGSYKMQILPLGRNIYKDILNGHMNLVKKEGDINQHIYWQRC